MPSAKKKPVKPKKKNTALARSRTAGRRTKSPAGAASRGNATGTDLLEGIFLLLLLFVCAVSLISDFGNNGYIGSALCAIQYGVFGKLCFIFPILLFVSTAFLMANHTHLIALKKVAAVTIAYLLICGLVHMFTEGYDPTYSLSDYYTLCSDYRTGGGVVGGALCMSFSVAFGRIGAIIIMILGLLICLILIFRPSLVDFVTEIADRILGPSDIGEDEAEAELTARDLEREVRYQKKERKRQEKRLERIRRLEEELARERSLYQESAKELENYSFDPDALDLKAGPADEEMEEALQETQEEVPAKKGRRKKKGLFASSARKALTLPEDEDEPDPDIDPEEALAEEEENTAGRRKLQFSIHRMDGTQEDEELYPEDPEAEILEDSDLPADDDGLKPRRGGREAASKKDTGGRSAREAEKPAGKKRKKTPPPESDPEDPDEDMADAYADAAADPFAMKLLDAEGGEETGTAVKKTRSGKKETENGIRNISHEIARQEAQPPRKYKFPPIELLNRNTKKDAGQSNEELQETAARLEEILGNFGVNVTVTDVSCGPTVTRYELQPEPGVKVSRIVNLADDIKLNLAAADIRIEAPIPGKAAVGIEVPNKVSTPVLLRDLISSREFQSASSKISFAVGKDIAGQPIVADIARMPHLLIAGATGSGKSVCINTLIMSILYKARPEEVQLIMIDPKVVELSVYNGIPHLLIPVVTDPKKASGALNWAVSEMASRYNTFAEFGVRNIVEYNHKISRMADEEGGPRPMSQIVIIVDELADLMMVAPGEVEDAICRLAQLARAAGIHLVIATQRPSVNVITGLIKANMPSRIAFAVSSGVDSRTILDSNGAEKLLGKGDMLFGPQGLPKPVRLQGAFVSDEEVGAVVEFLTSQHPGVSYDSNIEQQVSHASLAAAGPGGQQDERDQYFAEAGKLIIGKERASIGMLQRMFKIGFNRASRIMDQLSDAGVVGPEEGTKPRRILMTQEQFDEYLEEYE